MMMRALILIAPLVLAACGSNDKTITVKDGEGKDQTITVNERDATTTFKSEDGEAVIRQGADAAAATNFPAHAPQYPGSTVTASATFSSKDGEKGGMTSQETPDVPAKVMAFYKKKITDAGLKISMETTTPEGGMLAVESPGGKGGMMIIVNREGDKTTIAYTSGQ
jgi:hypothetical protein